MPVAGGKEGGGDSRLSCSFGTCMRAPRLAGERKPAQAKAMRKHAAMPSCRTARPLNHPILNPAAAPS